MPLPIENVPDGSPAMFQALISTGSPRVFVKEKSSEQEMSFVLHSNVHSLVCI